jgi:hypothetical protein
LNRLHTDRPHPSGVFTFWNPEEHATSVALQLARAFLPQSFHQPTRHADERLEKRCMWQYDKQQPDNMYVTLSSSSRLRIPPYRSTAKGFETSAACFRAARNTVSETSSGMPPASHYSWFTGMVNRHCPHQSTSSCAASSRRKNHVTARQD